MLSKKKKKIKILFSPFVYSSSIVIGIYLGIVLHFLGNFISGGAERNVSWKYSRQYVLYGKNMSLPILDSSLHCYTTVSKIMDVGFGDKKKKISQYHLKVLLLGYCSEDFPYFLVS